MVISDMAKTLNISTSFIGNNRLTTSLDSMDSSVI
jgi:hypothetical protein